MSLNNLIAPVRRELRSTPYYIWALFFIALIVRLIGINYGFPVFLNADEPAAVSSSIAIRQSLNPNHFDWPHLYFYLNASLYAIYTILRSLIQTFITLPKEFFEAQAYFVISRGLSAISGSLSVVAIYILTKKVFNEKSAMIAAIFLTFLPVHVYESHFAKPDILQTLVLIVAMYFIYRIYSEPLKQSNFIWAGVFIGMATSIKYGGALFYLPFFIAVILKTKNIKNLIDLKLIKMVLIAGITSVVIFYAFTPFALIDFEDFFSYKRGVGALWQIQNVGNVEWREYPLELYDTFANMYKESLGAFIWILFVVLSILFLFFNKREPRYILFLFPSLVLSFYISKLERSPQHYFLILVPLYLPAISYFVYELWEKFKDDGGKTSQNFIYAAALVLVLPSVYASSKISLLLVKEDTRTAAYKWIESNLNPQNDKLYVLGQPLDYIDFKIRHSDKLTRLDISQIKREPPLYVIIGVEDIKEAEILGGNRDPENLEGNSSAILRNADLVFQANDEGRLGPPIYIFRVNSLGK